MHLFKELYSSYLHNGNNFSYGVDYNSIGDSIKIQSIKTFELFHIQHLKYYQATICKRIGQLQSWYDNVGIYHRKETSSW